jgi:asparagine synthase (glutamine-hydrolysing)
MCGLAGIFYLDGRKVMQESLQSMADALSHRGPDGEGFWISGEGGVGFGHRRLSIIDLTETGRQPMHYAEGRYTIIYNGEIYNYIELKAYLTRFKYQFSSNSDTEVILALYDLKKEKCLQYLDGMFSFAIWDSRENEMFCARDRFGEKPFYYFKDDKKFVFASEIKSLKKEELSVQPDLEKIQSFINDNYKGSITETFFKNVAILPAAHYIKISGNQFVISRYWEIDLYKSTRFVRISQYHEQFNELLKQSVARRLRSDVPFGSSLSGGLDSSAIVCCISKIFEKNFNTFSARFNNHEKDEGKWIEKVVNSTEVNNFQTFPQPQGFLDELSNLVYKHEYPFSSTSIYAQWCVMKLAKQNNTTVLLDGQGADEYLAGYDNLKYFAIWELYRKGKLISFRNEMQLLKENFGNAKSVGIKFMYDPVLQLFGRRRKIYGQGYTLRERLKYAIEYELPELLRYADRNSMAHSVEVRLPFLNHQLVEFAFSLPPEQIYQKGRTKYVLREATKNILPADIYSRVDKIGFSAPEESWMITPYFNDAVATSLSYLSRQGITAGMQNFRNIVAANFIQAFS